MSTDKQKLVEAESVKKFAFFGVAVRFVNKTSNGICTKKRNGKTQKPGRCAH